MAHRTSTHAHYPFGIVGANLALMLADLLALRGGRFASGRARHWPIFEPYGGGGGSSGGGSGGGSGGSDPFECFEAFGELFCVGFGHLDHLWSVRGATRTDFGALIKEVRGCLEALLEAGPPDLSALLHKAKAHGIAH